MTCEYNRGVHSTTVFIQLYVCSVYPTATIDRGVHTVFIQLTARHMGIVRPPESSVDDGAATTSGGGGGGGGALARSLALGNDSGGGWEGLGLLRSLRHI